MSITNLSADTLQLLHKVAYTWLGVASDGPEHVIIAGGCLRDMWMGTRLSDVKDIDVFTTADMRADIDYDAGDGSGAYDHVQGHKFLGHTTVTIGGLDFNFIHFDPKHAVFNARTLIKGFDFSICQIAFDGYALEMMPEFVGDMDNKVLRRVNNTVGTAGHGERMRKKFPDWKFIEFDYGDCLATQWENI